MGAPAATIRAAHAIQFFDQLTFPGSRVAAFLAEALSRQGGVAVVATAPHLEAILGELRALGHDTESHRAGGRLAMIDAEHAFLHFAGPGGLDARALRQAFATALDGLRRHPGPLRVYGELVDVALRAGLPEVTLQVEQVWNELLGQRTFELLCGYAFEGFAGDGGPGVFERVCSAHGDVYPVAAAGPEPIDSCRLSAALQVNLRHSSHLSARRRELETEAAGAHRRLLMLHALTSALSEAATLADIARVVLGPMASAVGAAGAALGLATEETGKVAVLAGNGYEPTLDPAAELQAAFDARRVSWSLRGGRRQVCLPLEVAGRRWGAVAFVFAAERELPSPEQVLVEDLARQTALALERARLYDQARRSEARLLDANRRKDEFLAVLGHELRNPLAPITTALQLMKLRGDTASEHERAVIERQVQHVSRLVDDLLDVSRITQARLELRPEMVELSAVVAQAIEMASPLIERRGHRLHLEVPRSGLLVLADPVRLAQAVSNLLVNAAKFTDPGGSVQVQAVVTDGGRVELAVADTGVGIAPEALPGIFDAFVQGRRTLERSHGGLGLGLTLVRSVVRLHGGDVRAESAGVGRGSRFVIDLPAAACPWAPESSARSAVPAAAAPARCRVLVVDDNQDGADALVNMLRALGHEAVAAYDGPEALQRTRECSFDVAVLDIGLPLMDGYELARRLREQDAALRLLAMTGYGMDEDRARSLAAGFEAHFVKPLDFDRFLPLLTRPPGGE